VDIALTAPDVVSAQSPLSGAWEIGNIAPLQEGHAGTPIALMRARDRRAASGGCRPLRDSLTAPAAGRCAFRGVGPPDHTARPDHPRGHAVFPSVRCNGHVRRRSPTTPGPRPTWRIEVVRDRWSAIGRNAGSGRTSPVSESLSCPCGMGRPSAVSCQLDELDRPGPDQPSESEGSRGVWS
jgi:hypothetical protein